MSLFKRAQHALEQRVKSNASEGEVLQQSNTWMRNTTWGLMGTAVFGITWLALATTEEIIQAPGKLEPLGGVREIHVPLNGVVESLKVKEGEKVKKGQVLLTLDPEASSQGLKSVKESIDINKIMLNLKKEELSRYLELNTKEQSELTRTLSLNIKILERLSLLEQQGASSELQLLEQRDKVEAIKGDLEQLKVERLRQAALLNQKIQTIRDQQNTLENDLTKENVRSKYETLISPVDGIIFELKPKGTGFVSNTNQPILKIVPFDQLEARVEIPSSDIGFVRVGQKADISIDSFPASDFGVLKGTVRHLGSDALPPDQKDPIYRYPADIQLDSQKLTIKDGRKLPLQVGMSLSANIKLRKVSYLQLLFGKIRDKTESLQRI